MIDERILKSEERAVYALRSLYKGYGYLPFKMSKFEEYDLYVGNKDFLVSDRVITFNDTDGRLLALKPDVTLSIIKNTGDGKEKQKVYYNENVYRVSGSTGQFKEIMQTGLECIGNIDINDVFEVVYLAAMSLAAVSESYVLDVSHMGLLSALIDEATDNEICKRRLTELISEKNAHEVRALCKAYLICDEKAEILSALASMYGEPSEVIKQLSPICTSEKTAAALDELRLLCALASECELAGKVRLDFSVVNNMSYYDGIVFRGFLSGICEGVLAGGEYGKLLRGMGRSSRGIGFALYLDLLSELETCGDDFDVDVLLLYGEDTSPAALAAKKKEFISQGKSVFAAEDKPLKIKYREMCRI